MKTRRLWSAALGVAVSAAAYAQRTPLEKYEIAPAAFEHVYLDKVGAFPVTLATSDKGQYVGQVDDNHVIYGYGAFINNDGGQRVGQFRKGDFIFGITLTDKSATVGSPQHYASYSMNTGRLEYVFRANEQQLMDTETQYDYAFVSISYKNGDRYIGEIYKGKRHGYGIYYYANGNYWYGQYKDDVRCGFGALFTVENKLVIGQWNIEDTPRVIEPKQE